MLDVRTGITDPTSLTGYLPRSVKLLDKVRERVRYLHYSLQTEKAYVY